MQLQHNLISLKLLCVKALLVESTTHCLSLRLLCVCAPAGAARNWEAWEALFRFTAVGRGQSQPVLSLLCD
jgi:hypothetical protein